MSSDIATNGSSGGHAPLEGSELASSAARIPFGHEKPEGLPASLPNGAELHYCSSPGTDGVVVVIFAPPNADFQRLLRLTDRVADLIDGWRFRRVQAKNGHGEAHVANDRLPMPNGNYGIGYEPPEGLPTQFGAVTMHYCTESDPNDRVTVAIYAPSNFDHRLLLKLTDPIVGALDGWRWALTRDNDPQSIRREPLALAR